jgi:selenophosphate synthase
LKGVADFINLDLVPGGTRNNLEYAGKRVQWDRAILDSMKYILADAQTSGGLLVAIPPQSTEQIITDLQQAGITSAAAIGQFQKGGSGKIQVL